MTSIVASLKYRSAAPAAALVAVAAALSLIVVPAAGHDAAPSAPLSSTGSRSALASPVPSASGGAVAPVSATSFDDFLAATDPVLRRMWTAPVTDPAEAARLAKDLKYILLGIVPRACYQEAYAAYWVLVGDLQHLAVPLTSGEAATAIFRSTLAADSTRAGDELDGSFCTDPTF
jgi:hypothetical protein